MRKKNVNDRIAMVMVLCVNVMIAIGKGDEWNEVEVSRWNRDQETKTNKTVDILSCLLIL